MPRRPKNPPPIAEVVSLARVRADTRVVAWRNRLTRAVDTNKRALTRLFTAGLLFTKDGSKLGRDLLRAHQHLLRAEELLNRLTDPNGSTIGGMAMNAMYAEIDRALEKASVIATRTGEWLDQLRSE